MHQCWKLTLYTGCLVFWDQHSWDPVDYEIWNGKVLIRFSVRCTVPRKLENQATANKRRVTWAPDRPVQLTTAPYWSVLNSRLSEERYVGEKNSRGIFASEFHNLSAPTPSRKNFRLPSIFFEKTQSKSNETKARFEEPRWAGLKGEENEPGGRWHCKEDDERFKEKNDDNGNDYDNSHGTRGPWVHFR